MLFHSLIWLVEFRSSKSFCWLGSLFHRTYTSNCKPCTPYGKLFQIIFIISASKYCQVQDCTELILSKKENVIYFWGWHFYKNQIVNYQMKIRRIKLGLKFIASCALGASTYYPPISRLIGSLCGVEFVQKSFFSSWFGVGEINHSDMYKVDQSQERLGGNMEIFEI